MQPFFDSSVPCDQRWQDLLSHLDSLKSNKATKRTLICSRSGIDLLWRYSCVNTLYF